MPVSQIEILVADPADRVSRSLVAAMEAEVDALYADRPGSIRSVSAHASEMSPPRGAFVVLVAEGAVVGCGGLKGLDATACEIKRMYLLPESRGEGLGAVLLKGLEDQARRLGYSIARLDTGDRQPAAKRLYEGAGYTPIPDYNANTLARFWFEKEL